MDKILDIASQWMGLADSDGNGTLSRQELYDFFNQIDGITHNKQ